MRFRADIEGLRGIAVLLVVLFHIGFDPVGGGYIGVDVFFVISGFLITAQIVGEVESTGRLQLGRFWSRRLRRLMPMLIVAVVGTCLLSLLAYSPLAWSSLGQEAFASLTYISNVTFARDATLYFQEATSPFLHTWSLSVEEQFYVAWPLVVLAATAVARRQRDSLVRVLAVGIGLLSLASFALSIALTNRGTPWAFFGSPSRAWEFGAGALAMLGSRRLLLPKRLWDVLSLVGLTCIVVSALMYDEFTPFPGVAAVVPVAGTAVLVAGGAQAVWARRALELRWLRYLGRVSYAWYLFHWPAIVLAAAYLGTQRRSVLVAAAAASLALAHVATARIEAPFRESDALRTPKSVFAATVLSVLLMGSAIAGWQSRAGVVSSSGYLAELVQVRSARSESGSERCVERSFGGVPTCVYGDPGSASVVVLTGDSHAAQWAPALEEVAADRGLALIIRSRGGCTASDVAVARTGDDDVSKACLQFRADSRQLIAAVDPSLIVVAQADYTSRTLSDSGGFLSLSMAKLMSSLVAIGCPRWWPTKVLASRAPCGWCGG